MNILKEFTLKSLAKNKKRTIVTIIAIILTAAMLTGVTTLTSSFKDMFIRQTISNSGNYHIKYSEVPSDKAIYLKNHVLVEESYETFHLGYAEINIERKEESFIKVLAYDKTALETQPIKLIEGRLPQNSTEIIIDINLKDFLDLKVNQEVELKIANRFYSEEEEKQILDSASLKTNKYEIVGFIERPAFEIGYGDDFGALTFLDEELTLQESRRNVSVILNNPKDTIVKANLIAKDVELDESPGVYGNYSYILNRELLTWQGASLNQGFSYFTETAALIIMILIVIGSVIVIYNSFAISISERKKQYGMLRSVGATAKQIKKTVYWEGFVLSIIAVPIGILSGILGIYITLNVADTILQDILFESEHIYLVVSPLSIIVAVVFMVLTILLSIILPAKKASKISPIDAIRLTTDIKSKKQTKSNPVARFLFGLEGDIALKSLKRNRKRYLATVISLFISIVLFISFNSFVMYTMDMTTSYLGEFDYDVSVSVYSNEIDMKDITQHIKAINEIDDYVVLCMTRGRVTFEEKNLTNYTKVNFSNAIYENAEESFKDAFIIKEGDKLTTDAVIVAIDVGVGCTRRKIALTRR